MTSCPSCCGDVSAEIVPVTVSTTNLYIDDLPAIHQTQTFSYGDDAALHKNFLLTYAPYEGRSVEVFRNSGAQRYGIDFTIQNRYVTLTVPLIDANDTLYVRYWYIEGVSQAAAAVGTIVASVGDAPGALDTYLIMDGTTSHLWADFPELDVWFTADANRGTQLLLVDNATSFTLRLFTDVTSSNGELTTLDKYICTGRA